MKSGYRVKPIKDRQLRSHGVYQRLQQAGHLRAVAPGGRRRRQLLSSVSYSQFGFRQCLRLRGKRHLGRNSLSGTCGRTTATSTCCLMTAITQDPTFQGQAGNVPHHQFMLRSQLFLPNDVRLVNTGYYVGSLPNQNVDAYLRLRRAGDVEGHGRHRIGLGGSKSAGAADTPNSGRR